MEHASSIREQVAHLSLAHRIAFPIALVLHATSSGEVSHE